MTTLSNTELFTHIYTIRRFEETVLDAFPRGVFHGTTHTYLGQEANAVGVLRDLENEDIVFSNHRCHGHFLAYGGDARALFAEMMGKPTGVCGGVGGSQHLHFRNFFSSGILGGAIPIAVGAALAEKRKKSRSITIAFLGDGAMGEGIIYEALNMASLYSAPILFVVENNHIAQTTPIHKAMVGTIRARLAAFNIESTELDTSDVLAIYDSASRAKDVVRTTQEPRCLILNTARFAPHSKGDDTRSIEELQNLRASRDPIQIHSQRINPQELTHIQREVDQSILQAFELALSDPDA